jgi:glutamate/aspartate transport system substrate-binding protein
LKDFGRRIAGRQFAACALKFVLCGVLGAPCGTPAQTPGVELAGTLRHAQSTGVVTLGYRESSMPFSYAPAGSDPRGYSIDLCTRIVAAMAEEIGRDLAVRWVPVSSENRVASVQSGAVDLECGSTTNNPERRAVVAFSPIIFIAGTKLLAHHGSTIESFRDLGGKTVVVTSGTTNEEVMRALARRFGIPLKLVTAADHAQSYALVASGQADAFATDDALLYGLIARNHDQGKMVVVGEFLSYEPYGIMYRQADSQLDALVQRTFSEMAETGDLGPLYERWFMRRLPSGEQLDLPMSPQLENIFASLGSKPE